MPRPPVSLLSFPGASRLISLGSWAVAEEPESQQSKRQGSGFLFQLWTGMSVPCALCNNWSHTNSTVSEPVHGVAELDISHTHTHTHTHTHILGYLGVWLCAQSCLILCNPMDCSPPGFSVSGIFQAGVLEWVSISFSRGSSRPRNWTCVSCVSCFGRWVLYHCNTWEY